MDVDVQEIEDDDEEAEKDTKSTNLKQFFGSSYKNGDGKYIRNCLICTYVWIYLI